MASTISPVRVNTKAHSPPVIQPLFCSRESSGYHRRLPLRNTPRYVSRAVALQIAPMSSTTRLPPPVVLGLGSNLGDRLYAMRRAVERLQVLLRVEFTASSLFQSEPVGPDQPDFLNAALLCRTDLPLETILECAQRVEEEQGRVRAERWGPRTLDVDLLWAGKSIDGPRLQVPHPELGQRAFAMEPLLELWKQLPDGAQYPLRPDWFSREALEARSRQRLERLGDASWASA